MMSDDERYPGPTKTEETWQAYLRQLRNACVSERVVRKAERVGREEFARRLRVSLSRSINL